jgi:glycosyltransferase involved in cell wall biosynthesis
MVDIVDTIGRMYKKKKSLIDYIVMYNKKLFDRFILQYAHEIFVISTNLEKHYKERFPKKRITLSFPTTVDINEFKDISQKDISYLENEKYTVFNNNNYIKVFYAGTVARTNGIEFFLKVISEIIKEHNIKVKIIFAIIIGDENNLLLLAGKYGVSKNIIIVPPLIQENLPILLSKSDILFIPEQGNETANAGFPGKTAEYLMSGNPVITTNFSDLKKYLVNGENAFISEIGDFDSYKKNLKILLTNSDIRNKIGNSGKQLAIQSFSHIQCAIPFIDSLKSFYHKNNPI